MWWHRVPNTQKKNPTITAVHSYTRYPVTPPWWIWLCPANMDRFFVVSSSERKSDQFLSDQMSAHTNRFSLRLFVYDNRSVRVRLALPLLFEIYARFDICSQTFLLKCNLDCISVFFSFDISFNDYGRILVYVLMWMQHYIYQHEHIRDLDIT